MNALNLAVSDVRWPPQLNAAAANARMTITARSSNKVKPPSRDEGQGLVVDVGILIRAAFPTISAEGVDVESSLLSG